MQCPHTIGYSASKQLFDWKKATKIKFCVQTFVQKQNYGVQTSSTHISLELTERLHRVTTWTCIDQTE